MDFYLQSALSSLVLYKYAALYVITFLAALALPLPSAPSLMAAAAFASQGYMNVAAVIFVASLGNISGDSAGYWLARKYGHPAFNKIGLRRILVSDTYKAVAEKIERYRAPVVFFSRVNVLTTISVNIIAGLSRMPFGWFLSYVSLGEVVQVLLYVAIGYEFGANWEGIYNILGKFTLALVLLIFLTLAVLSRKVTKRLLKP